ncbi:MAG: Biopolymer transport protein ExbD [Elusimicrobia bacterium]|nr:Biopolymer transport protein ExbD [Elusimicrobiota bacterium]
MKMNALLSEEPTIAGVNIVPVIDLCLVLLIILMVTSPLLETADLPVKLPQASTIESKDRNISVTYSPDGRMAINTDMVEPENFVPALRKLLIEDPEILVILRVDRAATYGTLTDLIAECKKAGASNISIGTEQTKPNG